MKYAWLLTGGTGRGGGCTSASSQNHAADIGGSVPQALERASSNRALPPLRTGQSIAGRSIGVYHVPGIQYDI